MKERKKNLIKRSEGKKLADNFTKKKNEWMNENEANKNNKIIIIGFKDRNNENRNSVFSGIIPGIYRENRKKPEKYFRSFSFPLTHKRD